MAEPHAHSQPIETYGLAPHNRNIWPSADSFVCAANGLLPTTIMVIRTSARLIGGIPRTGHICVHMFGVLHWLPLQQRIIFCIGAMVWRCPGSCSGLPPRSLMSHPGHQRSQFTPLIGTGVTLCFFCSCLHIPGPCFLGG